MVDDATTTLTRRIGTLEQRLQHLETLLLRTWCAAIAVALVAGALAPYGVEHPGDDDERTWSVLSTALMLGQESEPDYQGSSSSEAVLFRIGFIGLSLVVLAMLGTLPAVLSRSAGTRAATTMRVLVILGAIGTVVVLLLTAALTSANNDAEARPGGFVLLAAIALYGSLLTRSSRELWQPPPVAPRRPLQPRGT